MTKVKALLLVLVIVAASAGFADVEVFILSRSVSSNQRSDTEALCSLRSDLQNRVTSGNNFLRTHPHGIPGISARTLRVSVTNAQRTLTALKPLVCPPGTHRREPHGPVQHPRTCARHCADRRARTAPMS